MNPLRRMTSNDAPALDWPAVFGRVAPIEVDVGFGKGLFLIDRALTTPTVDVLGFEHRLSLVSKAQGRIEKLRIPNARAMDGEAYNRITVCFAPASVSRFYVFFPDPWWKRRHHKRRLWTEEFAGLLTDRLVPGGEIFAQTDVLEYAEYVLALLDGTPGLRNVEGPGKRTRWVGELPPSPRERQYLQDGTPYYQMRYQRTTEAVSRIATSPGEAAL